MSVLVLSKGNSSGSIYKPFELREVHNYPGNSCIGVPTQIKTVDQPMRALTMKSEEQTSIHCQKDGSIPQLSLKKFHSQIPAYRGILKHRSEERGKDNKLKQVSFADLNGKVLTQVKEIPKLSEFEQRVEEDFNSISLLSSEIPRQSISPVPTLKRVMKKNQWSYAKQDCIEIMRENMVSLQEIILENKAFKGKVRVLNLCFEKSVTVRWSRDSWKNYFHTTAKYFEEKANTNHASDCFIFYLPCESGCIEFAIHYETNGSEYWDNNGGRNYQIRISQA